MKQLTLLMISALFISFAIAQPPSEKLFKKYGDKKGVESSVTSQPFIIDTVRNTSITSVIKTITISSDGEESTGKTSTQLFKSATKDCLKLLNSKGYTLIHQEKDDEETLKVCRYAKNGIIEMCVLEIDNDELTLTSTQFSGLTEEGMRNVKFTYTNK